MKSTQKRLSHAIACTSLLSGITLTSASAWACGPAFEPLRGPQEFVFFWCLFTIVVGWLGSIWTLGTLWKFRERLGGWRLLGITLLGAPALGFIATLLVGLVDVLDLGSGATNFNATFWGLFAMGMAAVYQTGFSLGAYRLFRKRDVVLVD